MNGSLGNILVCVIRPPGYVHADAFAEVAETVLWGFRHLGYTAEMAENRVAQDRLTIVFGAHLLPESNIDALPESVVIYNLEQFDLESHWFQQTGYRRALTRYPVWDYSLRNIRLMRQHWGLVAQWVPIGYVPEWTRIPPALAEDIDVLFYGSLNPRRAQVLTVLQAAGIRVHHLFGTYGPDRDAWIARSKIILNLHFYPASIFEWARVAYLLANHRTVVSETADPLDIDPGLKTALRFCDHSQVLETCQLLLSDADGRRKLGVSGYDYIQKRKESEILSGALATLPQAWG